ncbi:MAG: hypothetical protein H0T76_14765 [Nannocystis sp.]|nr:hypothetical protein [Nannocystis sp.]
MLALFRDLRFALRLLARNPAAAFMAIFTLALVLGTHTSILSAVDVPDLELERLLDVQPLPTFRACFPFPWWFRLVATVA